ncbi:carboxymuconolactone decarboxylase family protein [Streptomyces sp. NPDC087300]|uniref:carboxymuconolactone decarboxylase family protein n=1 Tax=Streptomyces sp. NPDC087300 TaxID=3365780 RepID=UPI0038179A68
MTNSTQTAATAQTAPTAARTAPTAARTAPTSTTHTHAAATPTPTVPRLNFAQAAPKAFKALIGFDAAARDGLDPALVELIQIRASVVNGCAYCVHMHVSDARKAGEDELRLHMIGVWREARHFFTEKEQAALALTESVTLVAQGGVPDDVYAEAARHFDEAELARVLALIFTINTWNRIALSTAKVAGEDERAAH